MKSLALMSLVRAVTIVLLLALALPVLAIKLPTADTPAPAAEKPALAGTSAAANSPAKPISSVAVVATAPSASSSPPPPEVASSRNVTNGKPVPETSVDQRQPPPRQSFAPPWGPASVAFAPPTLPPPQFPAPGPDTQSRRQPPPSPPPSARNARRLPATTGSKEPSSRTSQGPAPREYRTPPAQYRYGPRVDHRKSEQRQIESQRGVPRHDQRSYEAQGKTSRSLATPDTSRERKYADRQGGRSQLSEQKRQALMREYNTVMRRQTQIERELTGGLPGRPAPKRERYSEAPGR